MLSRVFHLAWALLAVVLASGCASWSPQPVAYGPPVLISNPALVPVMDRELVWSQVVDVVNDYFKIEREDPIRQVGDSPTEGHLETFPVTGATYFEPWRRDTVNEYERLESTLQSIRRRAAVRVMAAEGGFLIEVAVFKELEDVLQPQHGGIANAHSLRNDNSMRRKSVKPGSDPLTLGWIPLGRDVALEQQMLAEIQGHLGAFVAQPAPIVPPPSVLPGELPPPSVGPGVLPAPMMPILPQAPMGAPPTIPPPSIAPPNF